MQLENYDKAIEQLKIHQKYYGHDWELFFLLGECYYQIGQYKKAIKNYECSINNDNNKKKKYTIEKLKMANFRWADVLYEAALYDSAAYYYRQSALLNNNMESFEKEK